MTNRDVKYFFDDGDERATLFWSLVYGAARLLTPSILKTPGIYVTAMLIHRYMETYGVHYSADYVCRRMQHYVFGPILGDGSDNAAAQNYNPNAQWAPQVQYTLNRIKEELWAMRKDNMQVAVLRPEDDQFFYGVFGELRRFANLFLTSHTDTNYDLAFEVSFMSTFIQNMYREWDMTMEHFQIHYILEAYMFGPVLGMSSAPIIQLNNIGNPIDDGHYFEISRVRLAECPNARYGVQFKEALRQVYRRLTRPQPPPNG